MKLTNKKKLPNAFVNLAKDSEHERKDKHYSVTEILKPTRMIMLERRHEVTMDVSDMLWMVWGSAVHHVLENADEYNMTEKRFTEEVMDGYYLTGQIDLYNKDEFAIEDYKTASVWKVIHQDFDDWHKQGMMYAWLLMRNNVHVEKVRFHALLKDWSPTKARYTSDYPDSAIYTYEFDVTTLELRDIIKWVYGRFTELIANEKATDEELPLCTLEERWGTKDKYAVMKNGRKRAVKLYDRKEEAEKDKRGDYIEVRKGEDKRCMSYCDVCEFCGYWKERYDD